MTRRPNPPCAVCGTETTDYADRSGRWNKCLNCKRIQNVRRTRWGKGFLTTWTGP